MSKSHHITRKALEGKSIAEIDVMVGDPDSDLHLLAIKRQTKKAALKERKLLAASEEE